MLNFSTLYCIILFKRHIFAVDNTISIKIINQIIMLTQHHKNLASFIHIGVFGKFLFPFGNFIFPLILWTINKDKSEFINENGKQVLNFQLSILLYFITLFLICIPFAIYFGINIAELENIKGELSPFDITEFSGSLITIGLIICSVIALLIIELVSTIVGAFKANDGKIYQYPISIPFIK